MMIRNLAVLCLIEVILGLPDAVCQESLSENAAKFSQYPLETIFLNPLDEGAEIDGELENVWERATEFPTFVQTRGQGFGAEARFKTQALGFLAAEKLYLAFICFEPEIDKLTTRAAYWDDPAIIYDDRVEIFIDPDHDHRTYYHLSANSEGKQFDQEVFLRYPKTRTDERNTEWNCNWKVRTKVEKDRWIAEIEIDLKSLQKDSVSALTSWGFNVGRARRPAPGMERGEKAKTTLKDTEYSAWRFTSDGIWESISNFFEPTDFGDLTFKKSDVTIDTLLFNNASFLYGGKHIPPSQVGWNPIEIVFDEAITTDDGVELRLETSSETGKVWEEIITVQTANDKRFKSSYFFHQSGGESELKIQLIDRNSKTVFYQAKYILSIPPFVRYHLADIYKAPHHDIASIPLSLIVDDATISESYLDLKLYGAQQKLIASQKLRPLAYVDKALQFDVQATDLPADNYLIDAVLVHQHSGDTISQFQQKFTLNATSPETTFRVKRGNYQYGGLEGEAVQVLFPGNKRFVFWENASNVPWWDVDQVAVSYGYTESAGMETQGCAEALQDRECRYSKVEILESSDARILIHWQYALTDAHYKIHNNEWVDEYYYFYPDGVGVREVNLWVNQLPKHTYEFFEVMIVSPPSFESTDMFEGAVAQLTALNSKETISTTSMLEKDKGFYEKFIRQSQDLLVNVELKDRLHPFAVISFRDSINSGMEERLPTIGYGVDYANTNNRGHWPASEYAVDGYNLIGNHRPTHGNMGSVFKGVNPSTNPNQFKVLIGLEEEGTNAGQFHADSWLNPAIISASNAWLGYDISQRAYLFELMDHEDISFDFQPKSTPIIHPVFIIKNAEDKMLKSVRLNGQLVSEKFYKTGYSREGELILFMNQKISQKQSIQLTFNTWDH